jgi:hypothetical protein
MNIQDEDRPMKSKLFMHLAYFAALSVVGGVGAFYAYWIAATRAASAARPVLAVDAADLDMGELWEADGVKHRLTLTNQSSQPLTVSRFNLSCPCAKIEPRTLRLEPGETVPVEVTLDLATRSARNTTTPTNTRDWSLTIQPILEPATSLTAPTWLLKSRVRSAVSCVPPSLVFAEGSLIDNTSTRSEGFRVRRHEYVEAITVLHNSNWIDRVDVKDDSKLAGNFLVVVTPVEHLPLGRHTATLSSVPQLAGGKLPAVPYSVTAHVVRDVEFIPSELQLGVVDVDSVRDETVRVRAHSERPFSIVSCDSESDSVDTQVEPAQDAIRITVHPSKLGQIHESIMVGVLYAEKTEVELVPLSIRYYGK